MKTFKVRRSRWARGGEGGESLLLNDRGNMCCLGFFAKSCGLRKIKNVTTPGELVESKKYDIDNLPDDFRKLVRKTGDDFNRNVTSELMRINDSGSINEVEREEQLTKLFASIGVKVVFVP